ncbi:MAG TPA: hypothetical protein VD838_06345, partial [Anaeromyxobacteraceae bacterium]|nr:hypothetical protein [Anaeromyxobacteraceae bacterium]
LSVTPSALPVDVDVEGGEPVVRARPAPRASTSYVPSRRSDEARWLRLLVETEGPAAAREIADAESAVDALDARAAAQRTRIDELSRALADDVAAGKLVPPPRVDGTPEQMGRPPVPSVAPVYTLRGFAAALLVAETWQLSGPVLAAGGVDPSLLGIAAQTDPLGVALGLVFALGAAAAIFALAHVAVSRAVDVFAETPAERRRRYLGATSAGAALVSGAVAGTALVPGRWPIVVLLVAVALAAAFLFRLANRLQDARAGAVLSALAWDRERFVELTERGRRVQVLEWATEELRAIEADRLAARRRLRALQRRAIDAERHASEAQVAEARQLEKLADSLVTALELDRYLFIRLASATENGALLLRRDRPASYEPAVSGTGLMAH